MASKSGRFESQAMNALKKCLLSDPTGIDSGGYPQIVHFSKPSRCMSEWLFKPTVFMGVSRRCGQSRNPETVRRRRLSVTRLKQIWTCLCCNPNRFEVFGRAVLRYPPPFPDETHRFLVSSTPPRGGSRPIYRRRFAGSLWGLHRDVCVSQTLLGRDIFRPGNWGYIVKGAARGGSVAGLHAF